MRKLMLRLKRIPLMVAIGWKSPELFTAGTFMSMSKIMELILKVATEGKPMMTKMALVVANEQHDVATIWIGAGSNASPYDRIVELREENAALREEIDAIIRKHKDCA